MFLKFKKKELIFGKNQQMPKTYRITYHAKSLCESVKTVSVDHHKNAFLWRFILTEQAIMKTLFHSNCINQEKTDVIEKL